MKSRRRSPSSSWGHGAPASGRASRALGAVRLSLPAQPRPCGLKRWFAIMRTGNQATRGFHPVRRHAASRRSTSAESRGVTGLSPGSQLRAGAHCAQVSARVFPGPSLAVVSSCRTARPDPRRVQQEAGARCAWLRTSSLVEHRSKSCGEGSIPSFNPEGSAAS